MSKRKTTEGDISQYFSRKAPRKSASSNNIDAPEHAKSSTSQAPRHPNTSHSSNRTDTMKCATEETDDDDVIIISTSSPITRSTMDPSTNKKQRTSQSLHDSKTSDQTQNNTINSSGDGDDEKPKTALNEPSDGEIPKATETTKPANTTQITLHESIGDLFSAPPNTLLLHACNCEGSWGAGIAAAFQKLYPAHYTIYSTHCRRSTPNALLGTCLLIPPQKTGKKHWVGCLFTSRRKGRGKDGQDKILESTGRSVRDLVRQMEGLKAEVKKVWMCKINSGLFNVDWEDTKEVIQGIPFNGGLDITVMDKK